MCGAPSGSHEVISFMIGSLTSSAEAMVEGMDSELFMVVA